MAKPKVEKIPPHRAKLHVKKGDMVVVLSGEDKDRRGRVLEVFPRLRKVRVEGVRLVWRHQRPRRQRPTALEQQRGRIQMPALIDASQVMLVCPHCDTPTRPRRGVNERGQKVRLCRRCGSIIDEPGVEQPQ